MRHTLLRLGLTALLLAVLGVTAQARTGSAFRAYRVTLSINGQPWTSSTPALAVHGRVYVPLAGVVRALGGTASWDMSTHAVMAATPSGDTIHVKAGDRFATVGSRRIRLEANPVLYEHRLYVPARFLSQAFGATVAWEPAGRKLDIAAASRPSMAALHRASAMPAQEPQVSSVVPAPPAGAPQASTAPPRPAPADPPATVTKVATTVVKVTLDEYKIILDRSEAPAGTITFQVRNAGDHKHGFDIDGTDYKSGVLSPGQSTTVTATLTPKVYTFYCPVDGHRELLGMKARFTVK